MRCFACDGGVDDVGALFRVNPKSAAPAVWACRDHMAQSDAKVDPEVMELAELLSGMGLE